MWIKPQELATFLADFDDARLPEMLFRYRARNYPETLNAEEIKRWHAYCQMRFNDENSTGNLSDFSKALDALKNQLGGDHEILNQLELFVASKQIG